jgi:hypothetical protein
MFDVYKVNPGLWPNTDLSNNAKQLVNEKFDFVQGLAEEQLTSLRQIIGEMQAVLDALNLPTINIDIDLPTEIADLTVILDSMRPTPPSSSDLVLPPTESPPELRLPSFEGARPTADLTPPDTEFRFTNEHYESAIVEQLKAKFSSEIEAGGSGLSVAVENAIYERARERLRLEKEGNLLQVDRQFKGFNLPSGLYVALRQEAANVMNRALADLDRDILVKQAELAQSNTHFMIERAVAFEQVLISEDTAYKARALEAAKETVTLALAVFEAILKKYSVEADMYKADAQVYETLVKAAVQAFTAQMDRLKMILEYNVQRIKAVVDVYKAQVEAYRADIEAQKARIEAEVAVLDARIKLAVARADMAIKQAELNLQAYMSRYQFYIEALKTLANVTSQLVASALSGVNASASIGVDSRESFSTSKDYNQSVSNSASVSENYSPDQA